MMETSMEGTPDHQAFEDRLYPAVSPHHIGRPPMRMQWEDLTFLHWQYPADEVQALLPDGITVDTFGGTAWVGLVPFQMRVRIRFMPSLPALLHFPETNVRTYVVDATGRPGVWFFSLEASSLPAVLAARLSYQVPYTWAEMTIDRSRPRQFRYRSRRRWPRPKGATSLVDVTLDRPFDPDELGALDRFLTGRWALYSPLGSGLVRAEMDHEPWPLWHVTVDRCDDQLVEAAGLTRPNEPPLAHFAPLVHVRCGWPTRL